MSETRLEIKDAPVGGPEPARVARLVAREALERTVVALVQAVGLIDGTIIFDEAGRFAGNVTDGQRRDLAEGSGPVVRSGHGPSSVSEKWTSSSIAPVYRVWGGQEQAWAVDHQRERNRKLLESFGLDPDAPQWADAVIGTES